MEKAVFLDKDGTIIHDVPYNIDPSKIDLTPGCVEALLSLHRAGYTLFIISNQPGIAQGLFSGEDLRKTERFLIRRFASFGIPLRACYYCPHHPAGRLPAFRAVCACRKPEPGLILQAARDHAIDLRQSWMIGDILNDVEAGRRAGCRTVLIDNGNETEWDLAPSRIPDHIVRGLFEAAEIICREGSTTG